MSLIDQIAATAVKASLPFFTDTVTFYRTSQVKGSAGGNTTSEAATTPTSVPCVYFPASGSEREMAGKVISGNAYVITVPATYNSVIVDVDAKCKAVVAANTTTGQPSRTFLVEAPGRVLGAIIEILATLEE